MSVLHIERPAVPVEERPLARTEPLSVGRHVSNDVRIDEDGVETLHCRIAWTRDAFEIVAASPKGVEVNGTVVHSAILQPGDVIRVGSVDLRMRDGEHSVAPNSETNSGRLSSDMPSDPGLKPFDEEEQRRGTHRPTAASAAVAPPPPVAAAQAPRDPAPKRKDQIPVARQPKADEPRPRRTADDELFDDVEEAEIIDDDEFDAAPGGNVLGGERVRGKGKKRGKMAIVLDAFAALKRGIAWFRHRDVRPGQEDVVRSPFSLGMVVTGLVLVLASATLWFVIGRDSAQIAYDAATKEMQDGRYTQAKQLFEAFAQDFPRDDRVPEARVQAGRAAIEREIGGAAPKPREGLDELKVFINDNRDQPDFAELAPDIRGYAERIAFESAKQAERTRTDELIPVLREAKAILQRYPPPEGPQTELVARIDAAEQSAIDAIEKREWSEAKLADIEKHLEATDPMAAFAVRRELLARYADLERDARVVKLLERTREVERDRVVRDDESRDALVDDRPDARVPAVALAVQTRTSTDLDSEGRFAVAVAGGSCYGVDTVTGEPVWRRPIGLDPPFPPVAVQATPPAWLMFDTRYDELLLVDQATGELRWRQPVGGRVSGAPLIHDGAIYLPTLGDRLHKIDLQSGRAVSRLTFSQKVHSPPVLAEDGAHLVMAGDRDVFYTVSLNPLECVAVSYLAQPPAAIEAPLLGMGPLVLFIENDQRSGARLRVLHTKGPLLRQIAQARLDGQVRDAAIIRGRDLFVPYGDEAVAAFLVTDDENEQPLTQIGMRQLQNPRPGPVFLSAGPDGQLWMASTSLRKLQLTTSELRLEQGESSVGRFTQPLQAGRDSFFIARRPPYAEAIFFSQVDRDTLVGRWRVVLGGRIIGWNAAGDSAVCVTDSGHAYAVTRAALESGGFVVRGVPLNLPEDLSQPLRAVALPDGRVAVIGGGEARRLWLVNRAGQSESRPLDLPAELETSPLPLADGLVLPLPGRLRFAGLDGSASVREFALPVGRERPPQWKHLLATGDDALLAVDEAGLSRLIERQSAPPALAATRTFQTGSPIDVSPHARDGRIVLADAGRTLHLLDAATLEQVSETQLDGPATGTPWLTAEGRVLVEIARARLVCFDANDGLKPLWSVPIADTHLAGEPATEGGSLVVALRNGEVLAIDAASGAVARTLDLALPLTDGPRRVGDFLVVPTLDGALCRIESILGATP
ncbi:MAG: PQQ-binding-like beta-propeller repeat protein [Planctomycetaceae bacterium]